MGLGLCIGPALLLARPHRCFPQRGPVLGWPSPCGSYYEPQDAFQQKPLGNLRVTVILRATQRGRDGLGREMVRLCSYEGPWMECLGFRGFTLYRQS